MSARKEPSGGQDQNESLSAMERTHWETIKYARELEDAKRTQEYHIHQDELRGRLVELYDTKAQLERDLQAVNGNIAHYEERQEQLAQTYEDNTLQIAAQRREDDQAQEKWFTRAHEDAASRETARPKSSSSCRRQSIRDMPPQANGAGWTSINGTRRRGRREEEEEPPADPGNLLSSIYHNPVDEADSINGRAMPLRSGGGNRVRPGPTSNGVAPNGVPTETDANAAEGYLAGRAKDRPIKPKQRHSLPSYPAPRSLNGKLSDSELSGGTKAKSSSGRKSLPNAKGSVPPADSATPIPDVEEITRARLVLKDDGKVITEPALFAGIPLERIDKDHPYWDPEWEPLEQVVQPQLDKWKTRLEESKQDDSGRQKVFLANRQVNRGQAIVDFLRNAEWHPYQFVGKEMMCKFYKTFINYDTLFRLVSVTDELKKFDLDVTPLEWLRQRMYDLVEAQGDNFKLSRTIHDLYHDPGLQFLRVKHGYGNIGRPAGYKLNEKNSKKVADKKVKRESDAGVSGRRKARRSIGQVDPENIPSLGDTQKGGFDQPQPEYLEPVTPRLQKRQRTEPPPPKEEPEEHDLDYSGWTSTDSFSAGRIMHLDWRVYQIKTRDLTTSSTVTQYWTWKAEKGSFEHQVLRDVAPKVTWGIYQKPINFDLSIGEMKEIQYASDSQKILIVIANEERGNVLAYFKRERTKKRFLAFTKKKGIKLVKSTRDELEKEWDTMESKTMPNEEDSDV
ncbi:hypothetical protein F5Y05DRAFT_396768 [Hypoxylon sp. FL0543]|nr:hypothetical protein F5Y05DRAFT_396768 [Hypoxylon sp. FL0543]